MLHVKTLEKELNERISRNPRYSLRAFAHYLNLHPSALSRILSRKSLLTPVCASDIAERLKLPEKDKKMFLKSVLMARKAKDMEKIAESSRLATLDQVPTYVDDRDCASLNSMEAAALMELTGTLNFHYDTDWMARRLNMKKEDVEKILSLLVDSNVLVDDNGTLRKTAVFTTNMGGKATSEMMKNHQRQILQKSREALDDVSVDLRGHFGLTLTIDPERLPEIKKRFIEFMTDLSESADNEKQKEVYQIAMNVFPVSVLSEA